MQSETKVSKKSHECSICGNLTGSVKDVAALASSDHSTLNSSATEDLKKANTIMKATPCKACRELEFKKYELKKQQHKIERKLLVHKTLNHDVTADMPEKDGPKGQQEDGRKEKAKDLNAVSKDSSESYASVLSRLPFLAKTRSMSQPPQPRVKRLKGDVAKFVGRRNDGSDWHMIQPGHPKNMAVDSSAQPHH